MNDSSRPHDEELISAYLDGELSGDELARVEQLLRDDAELRQAHAELLALRESLQSLPREGLDNDFFRRVLRRAERTSLLGDAEVEHSPAIDPCASGGVNSKPSATDVGIEVDRASIWRRRIGWSLAACATAIIVAVVYPDRMKSGREVALDSAADFQMDPMFDETQDKSGLDTTLAKGRGDQLPMTKGGRPLQTDPAPAGRGGGVVDGSIVDGGIVDGESVSEDAGRLDENNSFEFRGKGGAPPAGSASHDSDDGRPYQNAVPGNIAQQLRPASVPVDESLGKAVEEQSLRLPAEGEVEFFSALANAPVPTDDEVPEWLAATAISNNTDLILQVDIDNEGRSVQEINNALLRNGIDYDIPQSLVASSDEAKLAERDENTLGDVKEETPASRSRLNAVEQNDKVVLEDGDQEKSEPFHKYAGRGVEQDLAESTLSDQTATVEGTLAVDGMSDFSGGRLEEQERLNLERRRASSMVQNWGLVVVEGSAPQVLQAIQDIQSDDANRWSIQVRVPPGSVASNRESLATADAAQQSASQMVEANRMMYRHFNESNIVDRYAGGQTQTWAYDAANRAKAYVAEPVRGTEAQGDGATELGMVQSGVRLDAQFGNEALAQDYLQRRSTVTQQRQLSSSGRAYFLSPRDSGVAGVAGALGGDQVPTQIRALIVLRQLPPSMANSATGAQATGAVPAAATNSAPTDSAPLDAEAPPANTTEPSAPVPVPGPVGSEESGAD